MSSVHTPEYQTFLRRLRQARKDAGYTQQQAVQALGKFRSFVTKCETGERRVDIFELLEFATLYNKPLEYFIQNIS